jgi:hypothetical protein
MGEKRGAMEDDIMLQATQQIVEKGAIPQVTDD